MGMVSTVLRMKLCSCLVYNVTLFASVQTALPPRCAPASGHILHAAMWCIPAETPMCFIATANRWTATPESKIANCARSAPVAALDYLPLMVSIYQHLRHICVLTAVASMNAHSTNGFPMAMLCTRAPTLSTVPFHPQLVRAYVLTAAAKVNWHHNCAALRSARHQQTNHSSTPNCAQRCGL